MTDGDLISSLEDRALALRRHVLSVAASQPSHLGGSMSAADLMAALFFHYLRFAPDGTPEDHFLLSKGHSVHVFHACLVELEQVAASELPKTGTAGSRLGGHPTFRAPGVEFATGSLGHALSAGIGIALAEKVDGTGNRTVVVLGDGELQEGTVWEAALCAPRFGLRDLVAIVDSNGFQASGAVEDIMSLEPLPEKWRSFGWQVIEVDGHDMAAIVEALEETRTAIAPMAIIARTIKGKGVPGVEGTPRAHYTMLNPAEAESALASLEGRS